ncbi:LysR family transcriptional regulator [Streptomyces griseoviridis]|uniref:Transcriptional regulator n=1 Tax=Streptomyces griseoviridis TaxID=45398 RepID=A0A918GRZ0_STRGD|nr:LysR family transcriptional regulator [Streptomyces niveoruber]GGS55256.1 transcriptional regulator [Streptomyces niveoruber]
MDPVDQQSADDPGPRLLRAFLALAVEGHFGHAAARLSIAQPSLSRQVRQLERVLGVPLFHRTPHGASLTDAGRLLRPEAERVLAQNARLVRIARDCAVPSPSVLNIAAPLPSPAGSLLSEAIHRFRDGREQARIAVLDLSDEEQASALAGHRIDAALTWGGTHLPGLASEELVREPVHGLVTSGHPLEGAERMPLSALSDGPLLFPVRERRHCWTGLRDAASAARVRLEPVPTAPAAVLGMVADGLGCSAVPASLRLSSSPGLAFVPLPGLSVLMSVMWRRTDDSPAVAAFVAACRSAATALIGKRPDIWSDPRQAAGEATRDGGSA